MNLLCRKSTLPLKFLLGDYSEKSKAETLQILKFAFSKRSVWSQKNISSIFQDILYTKDLQMSHTKLTYMINFGIAPFFLILQLMTK